MTEKFNRDRLLRLADVLVASKSHLIFCKTFAEIGALQTFLNNRGWHHRLLRSRDDAGYRNQIIQDFQDRKFPILITTEAYISGWRVKLSPDDCDVHFTWDASPETVAQGNYRLKDKAMRWYPTNNGKPIAYALVSKSNNMIDSGVFTNKAHVDAVLNDPSRRLTHKAVELIPREMFDDLRLACKQLKDAPHQEHFSVRLNDEENEALQRIFALVDYHDKEAEYV